MKKKLFNSAASGFIETLVLVGLTFYLTPLILNELGVEQYGLWILILSILGFFQVFAIGLPMTIQRSLTIHMTEENHEKVNTVFSCGILLFTAIGGTASLTLVIVALNSHFITSSDAEYLTLALLILSVRLFFQFFMMAFYGFFSSLLRFDIDNNVTAACEIIKALLILVLIQNWKINGLIAALLISDFLGYAIKLYYVKKIYPNLRFNASYISKKEILKLLNFSKHVMMSSLVRSINANADPIIITQIFTLTSVSFFSIPARLSAHVSKLASSIVNISFPVFTRKFAQKDNMDGLFNTIVCINLSICSFFFLPLLAMSETFIRLWVGEEFKNTAIIVFLLTFASLCQAYGKPIRDLLLAQENHKRFALVDLISVSVNIIFSIIFASYIGLAGVAAGTAIAFFTTEIVLYSLLLKKYNSISLKRELTKFAFANFILFSIGIAISYIIERLEIVEWHEFLLYALPVGLISLFISWSMILNRNLKLIFMNIITNKLKQGINFSK